MSTFDYIERTLKVVALIAIPVVVAIVGYFIQGALQARELARDYTKLAIGILQDKTSSKHLRHWAIRVLNTNSEIKLPTEAIDDLIEGRSNLPRMQDLQAAAPTYSPPLPVHEKSAGEVFEQIARGLATPEFYEDREIKSPGWKGILVKVSKPYLVPLSHICVDVTLQEEESGIRITVPEQCYSEEWTVGCEAAVAGVIANVRVRDKIVALWYGRSSAHVLAPPRKLDIAHATAADLIESTVRPSDDLTQHWVRTPGWTGIVLDQKRISDVEVVYEIQEDSTGIAIRVSSFDAEGMWFGKIGDRVRVTGRLAKVSEPDRVELDFGFIEAFRE